MIEYLPDFMAEWGATEYGVAGTFLAVLVTIVLWTLDKLIGGRVGKTPEPPDDDPLPPPPFPKNERGFVGRRDELARLKKSLLGGGKVQITGKAVVQGRGGLGKSTLAREFKAANSEAYEISLWVDADTQEKATSSILSDGCSALGEATPDKRSPELARQTMTKLVATGQKMLVVFDNVDNYDEIKGLLPEGPNVDLIITTRTQGGYTGFDTLELGVLDFETVEGKAVELVRQESGRVEDAEGARELAEALGGLPLALVTAGRLIREEGGSFADYQTRLEDILLDEPPQGDDYPDSIRAATVMSYEKLSDDAKMVADIFAWWAPEGLTAGLISDAPGGPWWSQFVDDVPEALAELAQDAPRVGRAVKELARLSLIEPEAGGSFAMHRLTGHSLRLGQIGDENSAAAALLMARFPTGGGAPALVENWPLCRLLTPHARSLWGSGQAPETEAMDTLLNQCGLFLSRQDDVEGTLAFLRASLTLKEERLGKKARDIPLALGNLAQELVKQNDAAARKEAVEKITRAIELDEENRPGSADLAARYLQAAYINLRFAAAGAQDQVRLGLERVAQGAKIRLDLFGPGHETMAHCYSVEASLHDLNKDPGSAIAADIKALAIRRTGDRGVLATSLNNLGSKYLEVGATDQAVPLLQQSYDILRKIHSEVPNHSNLRGTASWFATALLVQARAGKNPYQREAEAKVICNDHGLDFERLKQRAEDFPLEPTIDLPDPE